MTLREAQSCRRVIYTNGDICKEGVITVVGTRSIYVRYDGDLHSTATEPRYLKYAN